MPDTVPLGIPAVELAQRTDPGRDPAKQVNEDAVACKETLLGHLCVVCDGMGGHEGGREASNLALATIVETFERAVPRHDLEPGARARELLREAIALANRKVFDLAQANAVGHPGSTVVAILVHAGGTEVAHVGDSRCYRVHQGQIAQVTKDHSMVQQLVDAQVLTPEQAAGHPDANKITRALGMSAEVEVEVRPRPVVHLAGDVFVLCSDGLSDLVGQADIVKIAATAPAAQAAGQLVDLANARGGHDNISVIVLRTRETAIAPRIAAAATEAMALPTVVDPNAPPVDPAAGRPASLVARPPSLAARPPAGPSYHASEPPIAEARRAARGGKVSAAVVVAVLLGLVGLAVGGIALWLVLPHHKNTPPAPFVVPTSMKSPSPGSPAPKESVAPLPVEPLSSTIAPAEPLPSLVPSPPPPRGGRSRSRLE
jgi:protein phosphatase